MPDTVPGDSSTSALLEVGGSVVTTIDTLGDRDWYRVTLVAGHRYSFAANSVNHEDVDSFLRLYDASGALLLSDDDGGAGTFSEIHFTATSGGTYYIAGGTFDDESIGTFRIRLTDTAAAGADTVAGNSGTAATIALDGTANGAIDGEGDHDFYRVTLSAGQSYLFQTLATGGPGDVDSTITIRDASGNELAYNDDRVETYSGVRFTPGAAGTYYVDVGGWNDEETGAYRLNMIQAPPLQVYSSDQIAKQLTDDYWNGSRHHFDVAPGGTLTFNVSAIGAAAATLARQALLLWTDVTGIVFSEVATGGQLLFDDDEDGAFTSAAYSGGITTSATVNISQDWVDQYGTGLNSYSFQTFLHEIGHALGLGHGGPYNGTAEYPEDAAYLNDAWITTVMSYFDERENSYFAGLGFTRQYTVSPMVADGVAIDVLYGPSTSTRTGNTIYGFNNNSGRDIYDAVKNPGVAYTVFDNGGADTLDYSGFGGAQTINLIAEQFSSVGGRTGNVWIARDAVIENAIGGSGADQITGNGADNLLIGRQGGDTVQGGGGADWLYGQDGNDVLWGGAGSDFLTGDAGNDTLHGDDGAGEQDWLFGWAGDDIYYVDAANDRAIENPGGGLDTVNANIAGGSYALAADVENLTLLGTTFEGVGNELANVLIGNLLANRLIGGAGDDRIDGRDGSDTLFGEGGADVFVFGALSGADTIGDFTPGTDRIDVSAFGFASFAALQAATTDQGGNAVIALGGGNSVTLTGVTKAQLGAGDFLLTAAQANAAASAAAAAAAAAAVSTASSHAPGVPVMDGGIHNTGDPLLLVPGRDGAPVAGGPDETVAAGGPAKDAPVMAVDGAGKDDAAAPWLDAQAPARAELAGLFEAEDQVYDPMASSVLHMQKTLSLHVDSFHLA